MYLRFIFVFVSLLLVQTAVTFSAGERPNIIVILADDLGYSDLGCYGGEIQTPNLDRLAQSGLRFTQFYNEAKCTESRASLMTGFTHHSSRNLQDRTYPTIAERMQEAGYQTLMVGKWHLADTPIKRGFSRYFGFLNGAVNFWTGVPCGRDKTMQWFLDEERYEIPSSGFYTTDAFTDRALEFIQETDKRRPFFLYLAHNAPHYPLHAWPEDIEKYRGRYMKGWDQLRQERLSKMIELGVISDATKISLRDPNVPAWTALTAEEKTEYDLLMAVYAAMVDRLDQNIGRLLNRIRELSLEENTLILFASDNGGCPYQNEEKPVSIPGGPESHRTYNTPWANASNTPFRLYKRFSHEGGTSTPLIAYWPAGIENTGGITDQLSHLIDLTPTFLELSGTEVSTGLPGVSLVPALKGQSVERSKPIFWEYRQHRAVRLGNFKLVAESGKSWSLFDISRNRIESHDLSESYPEKVQKLAEAYDRWANEVGAPSNEESESSRTMPMKDYTEVLGARNNQ